MVILIFVCQNLEFWKTHIGTTAILITTWPPQHAWVWGKRWILVIIIQSCLPAKTNFLILLQSLVACVIVGCWQDARIGQLWIKDVTLPISGGVEVHGRLHETWHFERRTWKRCPRPVAPAVGGDRGVHWSFRFAYVATSFIQQLINCICFLYLSRGHPFSFPNFRKYFRLGFVQRLLRKVSNSSIRLFQVTKQYSTS